MNRHSALSSRRRQPIASDDGGMVTAELAAGLPVLVIFLAVVLAAVTVSAGAVRAQDAAAEAARAVARGDRVAASRMVRDALPGARLTTAVGGGDVVAVVTARVHPLGGWLPSFSVSGRAVATVEPGAAP